jgi:hypothetical protein
MKKVIFRTYKTVGLGRVGVDPAQAREKGCFLESGNQYCRQSELKNIIPGRKTTVAFTFDKVIDCQYMIVAAADLQPSHLGNVENPLHFLPEAQPRNRATSASGAETPRRIAATLRPSEIVEGANAYTGAPIVNTRGEVIQGNGRAFAMKAYWEENQESDPRGYLDYINQNAQFLGFDGRLKAMFDDNVFTGSKYPAAIINGGHAYLKKVDLKELRSITAPIIVRMVTVSDGEAIKLGQYKQSDLEAISTRSNEVKSKVNLLDDRKLSRVLDNVFAQAGPDDSLSEIIRNTNLLTQLIRLGAIRTDQLEEYAKNGVINAKGVAYVSDLLLFIIFKGADVNTPEIYSQLPYKIQNAIVKATPSLLRVDETKQIKAEVSKAILATRDFLNSGAVSVKEWEKQTSLFTGTPRDQFTDFERQLVTLFTKSSSQKEIVAVFEQYALAVTDQEADLISPARPGLSKQKGIRFAFFGEAPGSGDALALLKMQKQKIEILAIKYKYRK